MEDSNSGQLADIRADLRRLVEEVDDLKSQVQELVSFRQFYLQSSAEDLRTIRESLSAMDSALRGQNGTPGLIARTGYLEETAADYRALKKWVAYGVLTGAASLAWAIAQAFIAAGHKGMP